MERYSDKKVEIASLRNSLYTLLELQPDNKTSILKASERLDRAILRYIKTHKTNYSEHVHWF